ncbi:MAG: succinate dehydrogenase, cytochrome b556 subunit [Burkholderiales bacterium]|uniref:succinate dehydrogenase, cytochrome b556 subunit n=1 Tax=Nitrosomonas sp. TaxID=42353 RepID=UPI001DBD068B|nr:succinate dehydrogenase, cytochrome b556 subunit [Nitrosomonas sp.]MCB1948578.1 succinate dehydrogenase, cytochrome b556 subunit [Nitrosomonas sp.]MCP5243068.1 succinate dehydrogenase, cytochrome b556 subunit [Burkholderiales bacterium]
MEAKFLNKRPKHLNLFKISQPLPAIVSIMHRISGVLLFFPGIPILLYGLQLLLESPESFEILQTVFQNPLVKLTAIFFIWVFLHHLCAGIRHLALDLHYGIALGQARASSQWVLAVSILLTLTLGIVLW